MRPILALVVLLDVVGQDTTAATEHGARLVGVAFRLGLSSLWLRHGSTILHVIQTLDLPAKAVRQTRAVLKDGCDRKVVQHTVAGWIACGHLRVMQQATSFSFVGEAAQVGGVCAVELERHAIGCQRTVRRLAECRRGGL